MEEDRLQAGSRSPEGEDGTIEPQAPQRARASPPPMEHTVDPRHRRGSIGPPPAARPLGDAASAAALHSHLVHLLDTSRDAPLPPGGMTVSLPTDAGEQRLSPHEDPERQPDGIPHQVIGLTALFSVLFAAVLIGVLLSGPTFASISVGVLVVIAIPVLVFKLGAKAERERDHIHPSR